MKFEVCFAFTHIKKGHLESAYQPTRHNISHIKAQNKPSLFEGTSNTSVRLTLKKGKNTLQVLRDLTFFPLFPFSHAQVMREIISTSSMKVKST